MISPAPIDASEAKRFKSRTVVVEIDGHTRDVSLNDDTQLVDRNGSVRAVGTKAIKAALVAGKKVLVTWKPFWVTDYSAAFTSLSRFLQLLPLGHQMMSPYFAPPSRK